MTAFPWAETNLNGFRSLKDEAPELFTLYCRMEIVTNILGDLAVMKDPSVSTREQVQATTKRLKGGWKEMTELLAKLNDE